MGDQDGTGEERTGALRPLGHPVFRSVWISSTASNFGGMVQSVGASWMMVSIAGSATMVSLVQTSVALPIMLLALLSGAVADSFDRRKVMLSAQCFMLAVSAVLCLCAWMGWITPWLLLLFTFLIGCGQAFNGPAWQASVGDMVPREDLPSAIALNSMSFNLARSFGPAVGGAIVAAVGAAAAFAVNALSYVGLIVVLARWRPIPTTSSLPRETIGVAIAAGIRYVAMSPAIKTVLARGALFGFAAGAVQSLMPLIARDLVGGGALTYGLLLGGFGLGAVTGALLTGRLRDRLSSEAIARAGAGSFGLATMVAAISPYVALTVIALVVAGTSWVLTLSTFNVTVQLHSPRWVVARALSLYQMTTFGGMALGAWLWGELVPEIGIAGALLVAAGAQFAGGLLGLRLSLPEAAGLNLAPFRDFRPPDTAVPIEQRSGPVAITVEYRIARENRVAFLRAMAERRRIRRRDGARHWTLLRDLADPEIWIESFHAPTWLDYIRQGNRKTHEDQRNHDEIHALIVGGGRPVVRRMIERQTGSFPESRAPGPRELAGPLTDTHGTS